MKCAAPILALLAARLLVSDPPSDPADAYCWVAEPGEGPVVDDAPEMIDVNCTGMDTGED